MRTEGNPVENIIKELQQIEFNPDIAEPKPCYACGEPTSIALVNYEYEIPFSGNISVVISKNLPGYQCGSCELDYLDAPLSNRFLSKVAAGLANSGNDSLKLSLEGRLPSSIITSPIPQEVQEFLDQNSEPRSKF